MTHRCGPLVGELAIREKIKAIASNLGLNEFAINDFIPDVKSFLLKLENFFLEKVKDLWPQEQQHVLWNTYVESATNAGQLALGKWF